MKYSIVTFGCRVNQADSFQIEEQLIARGGTVAGAAGRRSRRREYLLGHELAPIKRHGRSSGKSRGKIRTRASS